MRVLFLISDLGFHGAQKQVVEMSRELSRGGHDVRTRPGRRKHYQEIAWFSPRVHASRESKVAGIAVNRTTSTPTVAEHLLEVVPGYRARTPWPRPRWMSWPRPPSSVSR